MYLRSPRQCMVCNCITREDGSHALLTRIEEKQIPSLNEMEAKARGITAVRTARRRPEQG